MVFLVRMYQHRTTERLRPRDSEAHPIVQQPHTIKWRAHLSRIQRPERRLYLNLSRLAILKFNIIIDIHILASQQVKTIDKYLSTVHIKINKAAWEFIHIHHAYGFIMSSVRFDHAEPYQLLSICCWTTCHVPIHIDIRLVFFPPIYLAVRWRSPIRCWACLYEVDLTWFRAILSIMAKEEIRVYRKWWVLEGSHSFRPSSMLPDLFFLLPLVTAASWLISHRHPDPISGCIDRYRSIYIVDRRVIISLYYYLLYKIHTNEINVIT